MFCKLIESKYFHLMYMAILRTPLIFMQLQLCPYISTSNLCSFTSSATTQRLHKNRAQSGMAFPNLIYWRHLDKSQSVISFDVVQKMRLPRETASGSRYGADRLPLRHLGKVAATLQLVRPHQQSGREGADY